MTEDVEKYKAAKEDIEKYGSQYAETTARLTSDMDAEDISTFEDFKAYREEYINKLKEVFKEEGIKKSDDEISEIADSYLSSIENLSTFVDEINIKDKLEEQLGSSNEIQD